MRKPIHVRIQAIEPLLLLRQRRPDVGAVVLHPLEPLHQLLKLDLLPRTLDSGIALEIFDFLRACRPRRKLQLLNGKPQKTRKRRRARGDILEERNRIQIRRSDGRIEVVFLFVRGDRGRAEMGHRHPREREEEMIACGAPERVIE
jgi:hypothetical protein